MAEILNYKFECLLVRLIIVAMTVNAQTIAPTSSPPNTTNATTFAPTLVPAVATSDPPTVVPVPNATFTAAPTNTPTVPPVMNTTAPTTSSSPTIAPSLNATMMPSDAVSASPTTSPTSSSRLSVPAIAPTKTPTTAPSVMPIISDTIPPVATENIKAAIDNIQIVFAGVHTIPASELLQLETVMQDWFETYFSKGQRNVTSQRDLHQNHRSVQQQYRVPSVRNMNTIIDATGQDTVINSDSNIVTYAQSLEYDATNSAKTPEDYALLPFVDTAYKGELLTQLQSDVASFANVTTISTPVIRTIIDDDSSTNDVDGGLSSVAIIGVVIAVLLGLILLVGLFYVDRPMSADNVNTTGSRGSHTPGENPAEPVIEYQGTEQPVATNEPTTHPLVQQQQQYVAVPVVTTRQDLPIAIHASRPRPVQPSTEEDYVVAYKDQSRSVIGPIAAVPDRNNQSNNDATIIPVASIVAIGHTT